MIQEIERIVERLYYAGKDTGLMITTDHAMQYVKDLERIENKGILTTRGLVEYLQRQIYELEYSLTKSEIDQILIEIKTWYRKSPLKDIIKEEWAMKGMVYVVENHRRRLLHRKTVIIVLMGQEKQLSFQVSLPQEDIGEIVLSLGEYYEQHYQKVHESIQAIEESEPNRYGDLYKSRIGVKSKHIRTNIYCVVGEEYDSDPLRKAYKELKRNEYREYMRVRYIDRKIEVSTRQQVYVFNKHLIDMYRGNQVEGYYPRKEGENLYTFIEDFIRTEMEEAPKEIKSWLMNEYIISQSKRVLF